MGEILLDGREVIGESQHGFTKGKLLLTKVVASYNQERELQMSSASASVPLVHCIQVHNLLVSNLERYGFDGQMDKELSMSNELQSTAQSPSETQ